MVVRFSRGTWYLELCGETVATISDKEVTKEMMTRTGCRPRKVVKQLFGSFLLDNLNETQEFMLKQCFKS